MERVSIVKPAVRHAERGQMLPVVGLFLIVLLGVAVLAVDVGYWRYQQRVEQSAADSAAIAGATELIYSTSSSDVTTAARNDSALNGFTHGTAGVSVAVNPAYNAATYPAGAVEVVVSKPQPAFFGGIFGIATQNVSARAVATLATTVGGCIYVVNGDLSGDLTLHGGGRGGINTTPLCGIVVDGNLTVTGQANVDGSYVAYSGSGPSGGSYPDGQPVHAVAAPDPCTRIPGCAYLANLKTTNAALFSASCQDAGGVLPAMPLPPGRYCYGTTDRNGNVTGGYTTSPVTLQSGLFIMDGGMFGGAAVSGTGVTIYNNCTVTSKNACSTTLNGGDVNNSIVAPVATPPNGNYAAVGMVYYQPPSLVNSVTVNGAAGAVTAVGGVYAPGASFTFNGQLPSISMLIAGTITMNGGGLNAGGANIFNQGTLNAVLAE